MNTHPLSAELAAQRQLPQHGAYSHHRFYGANDLRPDRRPRNAKLRQPGECYSPLRRCSVGGLSSLGRTEACLAAEVPNRGPEAQGLEVLEARNRGREGARGRRGEGDPAAGFDVEGLLGVGEEVQIDGPMGRGGAWRNHVAVAVGFLMT